MNKISLGIIIVLLTLTICYRTAYLKQNDKYAESITNVKALLVDNYNKDKDIAVLKLSKDQLSYYNDSILHKLDSVQKVLNVKSPVIVSYKKEIIEKVDTIIYRDTIFNYGVCMDTTIFNQWYTLNIGICYPNHIEVHPKFESSGYMVYSYKKETVDPPKKFFLFRWFQKKHKVLRVDYIQENPFIHTEKQQYIEIID